MAKAAKRRYLRTAEVAAAVGVHPNTVRLYEVWGFIPPVPRSPKGYRLYTERHLDLMRLARLALHYPYPGGKQPVLDMVAAACAGDLEAALAHARAYREQVEREHGYAEDAAAAVERWAAHRCHDDGERLLVSQAAAALKVTADALRNWEKNGLLVVPRHPDSGYRQYGAAELDRLRVIRLLREAGYSTMAILRVLCYLDDGQSEDIRGVLGSPPIDEDVLTIADRWLATLSEQQERADSTIAFLLELLRRERECPVPDTAPRS
ncbi:MAG: MerR family transcriptional regulator [Anaerolineae bacterium]